MSGNERKMADLYKLTIGIAISFTLLIVVSLSVNIYQARYQTKELAKMEALTTFRKDQALRLWASRHGGVYVPATKDTPPNPYLSHIKDRDIQLPSGKLLTLMNPAYMIRQVMEDYSWLYGVKGHITSLKLLNPGNRPDEWERATLETFEKGVKERLDFAEIGGEPYVRLMQPLIVQEGCLKCHGHQGYKVGNVRGGVGVSLPMAPFLALEKKTVETAVLSHVAVWLLGMAGIGYAFQRGRINVAREEYLSSLEWCAVERERRAKELEALNAELSEAQKELSRKNAALEETLSEMKEAHRKLAETKAQMLQSEKMASIGQLAAGVAHEINNPVGFVKSNLNTLSSYVDDSRKVMHVFDKAIERAERGEFAEAGEILTEIKKLKEDIDIDYEMNDSVRILEESLDGMARILSITKALKDFSHPETEQMHEHDINRCLENVIKIAWNEIKYKAVLNRDYGGIPLVPCHIQQIGQVFLNIILNAAQAITGKGTIEVRTRLGAEFVMIEIRDTGPGMTEDVQKRIFEPFYTTKPVGKGTGLGLSIAYGIVKEHKGFIEVESEPGRGTAFRIHLPLKAGELAESA